MNRNKILQLGAVAVIYLMIFLPITFAVTINNETVSVKNTFADFIWQTDNASTSSVDIGTTPSYGQNFFSNNLEKSHSVRATGLSPDTTYYYKISSSDGQFSDESTGTIKTPDSTPPPIPANLTSFGITKTSISFSWDTSAAQDFSKFTLYRNGVLEYEGTQASFTDTNLSAGTSYTFQVSAWDLSGNEGLKAGISATTKSLDYSPPQIKNITLIESTDTNAKISWMTDDNSTSIVFYRSSSGNNNAKSDGYSTSHIVQITVEKGKTVYYKVSSCNDDGFCSNSTEYGFKGGKDITPPTITVPSLDSTATTGLWYNNETININGKTEAFAFVQLWVNGDFQTSKTMDENGTFNFSNVPLKTSAQVNTLKLRSTDTSGNPFTKDYKIMLDMESPKITAIVPAIYGNTTLKISGNVSELSNIDIYITQPSVAPGALSQTVSTTGVQLAWNDTGASYYDIYRDGKLIGITDQKAFLDKDVRKSQYYNYQISSLNSACDESPKSSEVRVSTLNATQNQTNPAISSCKNTPRQTLTSISGNYTAQIDFQSDSTYLVRIIATDKSGNKGEFSQSIVVGTQKPAFSSVTPSANDWFYTDSIESLDIKGQVSTPNSSVSIWVLKNPYGKPDYTATADANGNFEIDDVNFASLAFLNLLSATDSTPSDVPRYINESIFQVEKNNLKAAFDRYRFYYIKATTQTGLTSDPQFEYFGIRTCYQGNFSWTPNFDSSYQSPLFVSTERLTEGTERLAFAMELKWVGSGTLPQMSSKPQISVSLADLDTKQLNSKAYNLTKIIANGMDFSNAVCDQTNTKCYFIGKPPPIADMTTTWGFDDWKQLADSLHNQIKLPLKITLNYQYTNPAGEKTTNTQVICKELSYDLDNTKLDPSKLPDWLVNGGLSFINRSIDTLDNILAKAKPVITAVGYVCYGSLVAYTASTVVRTLMEKMQMFFDTKTTNILGFGKSDCYDNIQKTLTKGNIDPTLDLGSLGEGGGGVSIQSIANSKTTYMSRLSDKDLKNCYPKIYAMWQVEASTWWAMRWSCDRIFCSTSPAPWTGEQNLPKDYVGPNPKIASYDDIIRYLNNQQITENGICKVDDLTKVGKIRKADCDFKDEKNIIGDGKIYKGAKNCYLYDNSYWFATIGNDGHTYDLKRVYWPVDDKITVTKETSQKLKAFADPNLKGSNPDELFTAKLGTCQDNCKKDFQRQDNKVIGVLEPVNSCKDNTPLSQNEKDKYNIINKPALTSDNTANAARMVESVTYGTEKGEELDAYIQSLGASIPPEQQAVQCCCVSLKQVSIANTNIITPFNGDPEFNKDIDGNPKDKAGNQIPATWVYRYAQTGFIYPITQQYEPKGGILDTISSVGSSTSSSSSSSSSDGDYKVDFGTYGTKPTKTQYASNLYFEDRDRSANPLKLDQLTDYGSDKRSIPKLDPRTQHLTAVSTLCLTGIYNRLMLIRNALGQIRDCLISAKTTSAYNSEVCKEIFSQYVCSLVGDLVVRATSKCSQFNLNNFLDTGKSNYDAMGVISAGLTGVTEGLTTSLGNFQQQYDNTAVNTLLGGGVGSVAQKACMAALGYDWGIDFNSLMDAAYKSEYNTNVFAPTLRRTYLFYNPATGKPVYEYRGGVIITPGCDITGFSASLVCVTALEKQKYSRDITCQGGSVQCPCLYASAPIMSITNPLSPFSVNVPLSSGLMTQGVPTDRAFHQVVDTSSYVYDHLRIQLFMDEAKKKNCLGEGYQDGVFYFPINDRTPYTSLGCEARADGTIYCKSNMSTDFFGYGNVQVTDVVVNDAYYLKTPLMPNAIVTKTGTDKACLYYELYKGTDTTQATNMVTHGVIDLNDAMSAQQVQLPVYNVGGIPDSVLGGTTQMPLSTVSVLQSDGSISELDKQRLNSNGYSNYVTPLQVPASGTIVINLQDNGGGTGGKLDGVFKCSTDPKNPSPDMYSIGSSSNFIVFPNDCIIRDGDTQFRFDSLTLPLNQYAGIVKKISATFNFIGQNSAVNAGDFSLLVKPAVPANKDGNCQSPTFIPNGQLSRSFKIYRTSNLASCTEIGAGTTVSADCNCGTTFCSKGSTCTRVDAGATTSYTCKPNGNGGVTASAFEPIRITSSTGDILTPTNDVYSLDSSKDYYLSITQGKSPSEISSIAYYDRKEGETIDRTSLVYSSSELTSYLNNGVYKLAKLGASDYTRFGADTYYLGFLITLADTGRTQLKPTEIKVKMISTGLAVGQSCGPTGTEGTCRTDCSDVTKGISESTISDSNKKCSGTLVCCKT